MKKEMLLCTSLFLFILLVSSITAQTSKTISTIPAIQPSNPVIETIKLTYPPSSSIGSIYKTAEDLCKINGKITSIEKLNKDLSLSTHQCGGDNNFKLKSGEGYRFNIEANNPEEAKLTFQGTQELNSKINFYNYQSIFNKSIISEIYLPEAWNSHSANELCSSIPEAIQVMQSQLLGDKTFLLLQFCNGPGNITLQISNPVLIVSDKDSQWNSLAPGQKPSRLSNLSPTKIFLLIFIPVILILVFISIYYIIRKLKDEKVTEPSIKMMSN